LSDDAGTPGDAAPSGGGDSVQSTETAPAAPAAPRFSLAIDGKEQELSAEELTKHWDRIRTNYAKGLSSSQMMTKAEQRLRQAQEYEKKYAPQSIAQRLKDANERQRFLEEMGIDRRQFAEELLLPEIQQEMLTAEERRLADAERRAATAEQRLKQREEQEQATRQEQAVKEQQQALGQRFVEALQKAGIPEGSAAWGVRRMAALMDKQLELGMDLGVDELAGLVREDFARELRSTVGGLDGAGILEFFGKELVQKIRAHDLATLKARQPGGASQPVRHASQAPTNGAVKSQYLTPEQRDLIIQERLKALQQQE
jgi:hypothetical protein